MNPINIAVILPGLHKVQRGAEVALESIAEILAKNNRYRLTLFGMGISRPSQSYTFTHIAGFRRELFSRFPKLPGLRNNCAWEELTFSPHFFLAYRPNKFDVTISCSYPFINWILKRDKPPIHLFVTQNGDWPARSDNSEFKYFSCDGLICTNLDYYETNKNRWNARYIPNGVDPIQFCPGTGNRELFNLPSKPPIALMVSALSPSKRVIEGIEAISGLEDVHLAVAGNGELRDKVKEAGRDILKSRFHLLHVPRPQMPILYRSVSCMLHMSIDEPSSNAYLEAMATGLPVVTHKRRVTTDTFADTAYLDDMTDPVAVRMAIIKAVSENSHELEQRRRERAIMHFSWDHLVKDYEAFIDELLSKK